MYYVTTASSVCFKLQNQHLQSKLLNNLCSSNSSSNLVLVLCPIFFILFSKSLTTLKKFKIDEVKVCPRARVRARACVCVCVSLTSDSSETIKVIIINNKTCQGSCIRPCIKPWDSLLLFQTGWRTWTKKTRPLGGGVLIIFISTLIFIQGHTEWQIVY